jgi:hypothetical protein
VYPRSVRGPFAVRHRSVTGPSSVRHRSVIGPSPVRHRSVHGPFTVLSSTQSKAGSTFPRFGPPAYGLARPILTPV